MAIRIASPAAGRVHLKGGENVQKVMGASLGHGASSPGICAMNVLSSTPAWRGSLCSNVALPDGAPLVAGLWWGGHHVADDQWHHNNFGHIFSII